MYWYYPPYVTVAERKKKAQKRLQQLRKKNPDIQPVLIEGQGLSKTWWAKAWNANLESYADYRNRIERGRSYVKNGFILDLSITSGRIEALVLGSAPKPYSVGIQITKLTKQKWAAIKKRSKDRIDSLQSLLDGSFPKDLEELFRAKDGGLFPSPKEIKLSCSCPDWAIMCKHVAATLYGVGARLDTDPGLFFSLRGVVVSDLVGFAVARRKEELLDSARNKKKSSRILESGDADLAALFDIDLAAADSPEGNKKLKKKTAGKKTRNSGKLTAKKSPAKKVVSHVQARKKFGKKSPGKMTAKKRE